MHRIGYLTKQTFGALSSVSKHQYNIFRLAFSRNSKQVTRHQGYYWLTGHLNQNSLRTVSTSSNGLRDTDDGFTLRPATHADCEAVKNIDRNIGSGFDTVLFCYHQNISMDTRFNTILEKSGKVLILSTVDAALSEYPDLKKISLSSLDGKNVSNNFTKPPLWNWIMQRPVESFLMNTDTLAVLCGSEMFHGLEKEFHTDAIIGFPKRQALKLLTEEICHLEFALRVPMIGFQPSGWKASTLGNQLQITDPFVSRCPLSNKIKAFSFMTITRGDYGVETNSEFYCEETTESEDLAITHLLHYIREMALLLYNTNIVCCFHYPTAVNRKFVKHVLNTKLDIPSNVDDDWTASLYECSVADTLKLK